MGSYNEYEEKQSRLRGEKERAKGLRFRWVVREAGE